VSSRLSHLSREELRDERERSVRDRRSRTG